MKSTITKTPLRYRGPIESLVVNNLRNQIVHDIHELDTMIDTNKVNLNNSIEQCMKISSDTINLLGSLGGQ